MTRSGHNRTVDSPTGSESGASSVEYGLLASCVAAVVVATVAILGGATSSSYHDSCDRIDAGINSAATCPTP